jgi:stage IV sporulation protein FB
MPSRQRLISALTEHGPGHPARNSVEPCEISVSGYMALGEALEQLGASDCPALPVIDAATGRIVGLLTAENAGELMLIKAALKRA